MALEGSGGERFDLVLRIGPGDSDCLGVDELPETIERRLVDIGHDPDGALFRGYDAAEGRLFLESSDDLYAMRLDEWKHLRDQTQRFGSADLLMPHEYARFSGSPRLADQPTIGVFDADRFRLAAPHENDYYYETIDREPAITGMLGNFTLRATDELGT